MIAYILSKLNVIKNRVLRISNNMYHDLYGDGSLGDIYYGSDSTAPNALLPADYTQILNSEGYWAQTNTSAIRDKSFKTTWHPTNTVEALHYLPTGRLYYNNLWIGPKTMLAARSDLAIIFVKDTLTLEQSWISSNSTHTISARTTYNSNLTALPKLKSMVESSVIIQTPEFIYTGANGSGGSIFVYYNTAKVGPDLLRLKDANSIKAYLSAPGGSTDTSSGGCLIVCAKNIRIVDPETLPSPAIEAIGGTGNNIDKPGITFETRCTPIGG